MEGDKKENRWYASLNLGRTCAKYRVSIWQCPQFLFLIMGMFIVVAILLTYQIARHYQDPEMAALIVLALSGILFAIGNMIIRSFERVALSSLSKSEFISIISHQLRSPLSAIKWQINMFSSDQLQGMNALPESMKGYIEGIAEQNERMIRSVNDLLEVNKIEDHDIILKPVELSLDAVTQKVVHNYQKLAQMNNVRISIFVQPDLGSAYADEERIKRVVEHLLDNAIRYSLSGGEVTISIEKQKERIVWKITDQGAGIPPEEQKKVFEKFFRSNNVARYQTVGSGIGLFIAKSIVKLSGGEMGFFSAAHKGSTFWFTLPMGDKGTY